MLPEPSNSGSTISLRLLVHLPTVVKCTSKSLCEMTAANVHGTGTPAGGSDTTQYPLRSCRQRLPIVLHSEHVYMRIDVTLRDGKSHRDSRLFVHGAAGERGSRRCSPWRMVIFLSFPAQYLLARTLVTLVPQSYPTINTQTSKELETHLPPPP